MLKRIFVCLNALGCILIILCIFGLIESVQAQTNSVQLTKTHPITYFVHGFDIGDIDNDGVKELAVSDPINERVVVYNANFTEKYSIQFPPGVNPRVLLIYDFDQDGNNELAIGTSTYYPGYPDYSWWQTEGKGYAYLGEVGQDGTFTQEWQSSETYYFRFASQFAAGDHNGNGKHELIIAGPWYTRKLVRFEYDGNGGYNELPPIYFSGSDVLSAFIREDLLVVGTAFWSDYSVRVYRNYTEIFSSYGGGSNFACAGDVDGDGKLDIIRGLGGHGDGAKIPPPTVSVFSPNANGSYSLVFTSEPFNQNSDQFVLVGTGEFIPGGGEEIAVGTFCVEEPEGYLNTSPQNISLFQYNGTTYEEIWREDFETFSEGVRHLKIADLNGDGHNELYVSTQLGLYVYSTDMIPQGVDLTGEWTDFSVKASGKNNTVNGTFLVQNVGSQDAESFTVGFCISDDNFFDATDSLIKQAKLKKLPAGGSQSLSLKYQTRESLQGKYIVAVVDYGDKVLEVDDENNMIPSTQIQ